MRKKLAKIAGAIWNFFGFPTKNENPDPPEQWTDDNSWPQGSAGGLMGTDKSPPKDRS